MTVKQIVNLTTLKLKVVVTDDLDTYELDLFHFNCPFNDYKVISINVKDGKLYIRCEEPKQVHQEEE